MLEVSKEDVDCNKLTSFKLEDRFITLPIKRYLNLIPTGESTTLFDTLSRPQIAIINAINNPAYRFVTACISRRLGKTYISNIILQLVALEPNNHVLIISPNYSLSSISWDLQKSLIRRFDIEVVRMNAKDRIIELSNGSTIRIGSVSQVDSCVGRSYKFILFDEAALEDGMQAFNMQLRPTLDTEDSKAIFISTPRGKNWFHKLYEKGFVERDWVSVHADWLENDRASEEDILAAKRTMSEAEWKQEYYASFIVQQGRIFNLPSTSVFSEEVKMYEDTVMGVDLGFRDPTAMIVARTDGVSWYIIDEYEDNGKSTRQYAGECRKFISSYDVDFIYVDSANAQMKYDFAVEYDIFSVNADKAKLLGIGYVQSLIENRRLFVSDKCVKVLRMLDNYAWDPRPGLLVEKPLHDEFSHLGDALRYLCYSHRHALVGRLEDGFEDDDEDWDTEDDVGEYFF